MSLINKGLSGGSGGGSGEMNVAIASQAEAEAGAEATKTMTALRTAQAIAALGGGGGSLLSGTFSNTQFLQIDHSGLIGAYDLVVNIDNTNNTTLASLGMNKLGNNSLLTNGVVGVRSTLNKSVGGWDVVAQAPAASLQSLNAFRNNWTMVYRFVFDEFGNWVCDMQGTCNLSNGNADHMNNQIATTSTGQGSTHIVLTNVTSGNYFEAGNWTFTKVGE